MTDDLIDRCVARRLHGLEDSAWFLALSEEDRCEAYCIAYLLGVEDARDIRRAAADVRPDRQGD